MSQSVSSVLLVSLVGFPAAQAHRLALLLDDCSALGARWRVTKEGTGDIWIVNGAHARSLGRGLIEVGDDALMFRPAEMPHPVAFTQPLDESISTSHVFDPESMHSLNMLLTRLGRWLTSRLVQQALVGQLVANGASFTRSQVIEVHDQGRVLALLDVNGDTAVAPDATPANLKRAVWLLRERCEAGVPPGFRSTPTELVLWQFALRNERMPLLPARCLRLPIHLRRMPTLPARELSDAQLALVRELAYGPRTLAELVDRMGADPQALRRDLGALYLIGAITCDPGRSRAAREHRRAEHLSAAADPSLFGAQPSNLAELTAPGLARALATA